MSSSSAEQKVKKLARLPSNTCCANCGTTKKFGFSTVCIKYFTFVCNNCKSSHQAISHRCKSLTMSSWTDQEVMELQRKGNDYARRTWLKNAPPIGQGGRPREGDSVDVFKRFVVDVYERKRYYGEDEGVNAAPAVSSRPTHFATAIPSAPKTTTTTTTIRAPVRMAAPPPAPPPAAAPVVADLLDFTSMPSTTTSQASVVRADTGATFEANFDAFAPKPPAQVPAAGFSSGAASVATATAAVQNDPFQPTQSAAISTGSSFNFINNNNNNSSSSSNVATASLPGPTAPTVPAIKKPAMNNHNMCQKSSMISSMTMPGTSNNQHGKNGMMGNGMGMGWNNNGNAMNQSSFGGMGGMQPMQQQMTMQQQQMMMMQQKMNMMNGVGMGMGMGMVNNNATGNGMMNHMMNQQRNPMMHGNSNFGTMVNTGNRKLNGAMDSLQMDSSSMSAWSSGLSK